MKTALPSFIITAAVLFGALDSGSAVAARLNLERNGSETGYAWIDQAREAEAHQDYGRAQDLFSRAAILPGTEEAGTVGLAHVQQVMGDLDKSLETLNTFVRKINPFSVDAHLALVDAYLALGREADAEAELATAEKLRPSYAPANQRVAVIAFRKGNYRLTVAALTKVLERNPTHARALELRARAYLKLEKYSSALADYKILQGLEPNEFEHYLSIGQIYVQLGELDVAERYFSAVLGASELPPAQRVRVLMAAGQLEQLRHNEKRAVAFFKRAYEANPADIELGLKLSDLYAASHNLPQAQVTLDKIMENAPASDAAARLAFKLSDLYVSTRNYPAAQQVLAKVMESSPGNEAAARRMMELYQLLGRRDGLGVFLKNYLDSYPDKPWAMLAYSRTLIEIGDLAGADEYLRGTAIKNGYPTSELALEHTRLLGRLKRFADAKVALQKAIDKFPKDDRLHFDLALCWEKLDEPKKAASEYEKVTGAEGGSVALELKQKAVINLAQIVEKSGDTARAYALLRSIEPTGAIAQAVATKIEELGRTLNGGAGATRRPASE